jgi:uncharacterized membrane protein
LTRQPVPDLLKGIAVIAMIQVHILEQLARPEIFNGPPGKVSLFLGGPFAAPVFMAVMGYFVAVSKRGSWNKLRRGIFLIFLGLLLNIGLNFNLLLHILGGKIHADPLRYIFGADILPLAGLSIIFLGLTELILKKRAWPIIALAFAIPLLTDYLPDFPSNNKYLQAFISGPSSWSYFPLFPWMAYPLLGYGWKRLEIEMPSLYEWAGKHVRYFIIPSLVLLIALAVTAFKTITDLPAYYHHGILLFLWMIGFLYGWTYLVSVFYNIAADSQIIKYIKWLGEHVTLVYVIQWLIIGNLAFYLSGTQYLIQLLLWFVAVLAITSLLGFLILRLWKKRSWSSA